MKKEIFVLEDDDGIRELIHFLLENHGYEVQSFSSVGAFKEQIQLAQPDLIVLDIWLPDGDGRMICRELRMNASTSGLPVVMMTASSDIHGVNEADDFIPKPFDIEDFVARIENLLPT